MQHSHNLSQLRRQPDLLFLNFSRTGTQNRNCIEGQKNVKAKVCGPLFFFSFQVVSKVICHGQGDQKGREKSG